MLQWYLVFYSRAVHAVHLLDFRKYSHVLFNLTCSHFKLSYLPWFCTKCPQRFSFGLVIHLPVVQPWFSPVVLITVGRILRKTLSPSGQLSVSLFPPHHSLTSALCHYMFAYQWNWPSFNSKESHQLQCNLGNIWQFFFIIMN